MTFGRQSEGDVCPLRFRQNSLKLRHCGAINSIGSLSGYFAPSVTAWIKDATGGLAGTLVAIAARVRPCNQPWLVLVTQLAFQPFD